MKYLIQETKLIKFVYTQLSWRIYHVVSIFKIFVEPILWHLFEGIVPKFIHEEMGQFSFDLHSSRKDAAVLELFLFLFFSILDNNFIILRMIANLNTTYVLLKPALIKFWYTWRNRCRIFPTAILCFLNKSFKLYLCFYLPNLTPTWEIHQISM